MKCSAKYPNRFIILTLGMEVAIMFHGEGCYKEEANVTWPGRISEQIMS